MGSRKLHAVLLSICAVASFIGGNRIGTRRGILKLRPAEGLPPGAVA